jgi:hypothetical protein
MQLNDCDVSVILSDPSSPIVFFPQLYVIVVTSVSTLIEAEGLMMDQSLPEYAMREGKLASHFSTVRFRLVTESTIRAISLKFIDQTKTGQVRMFHAAVTDMRARALSF